MPKKKKEQVEITSKEDRLALIEKELIFLKDSLSMLVKVFAQTGFDRGLIKVDPKPPTP